MTDIARDELAARLGEDGLVLLDVRTLGEYEGAAGYACDPRQGHIPGARHLDLQQLMAAPDADGLRTLVGAPAGAEVIVYCHSGGRSDMAAQLLAQAGYAARNYVGSWHDWSAAGELPITSS